VYALAGGELSEVVWELVGFSHDTNNLWDLGQVKIFATEVRVILSSYLLVLSHIIPQ
jgi:hypothetical protein